MRAMYIWSAVMLASLAGQPAEAPAPKVKTLVLDAEAPAAPDVVRVLTDTVVNVYGADEGREVIAQSEVAEVLDVEQQKMAAGCDAVSCLAEIALALDADTLVKLSVAQVGEQYVLSMSEFSADTGRPVARMQSRCQADDGALLAAVEQLTTKLLQSTRGEVQFFGTISVKTVPGGGQVYVDGERLGPSPVSKAVPVGAHQVRVVQDGDEAAVDVEVRRKLATDVEMALRYRAPPPPEVLEAYEQSSAVRPVWLAGELGGGTAGLLCGGCCAAFGGMAAVQSGLGLAYATDDQQRQGLYLGIFMWGAFAVVGTVAAVLGVTGLGYGVYDLGFGAPEEPADGPVVHRVTIKTEGEAPRELRLDVGESQRH